MSLEGKVALVTGASRGIGKAIAEALAAQGAKVIGTATSENGAESISAYLGESGRGAKLDVNNSEEINALFKSIKEEFGDALIVVNNAGITKDNLFLRMKEDQWDDVISTNLSSVFRVSKAAIKAMSKARFGRIINISSVIGCMGNAGQVNYGASKAGVEGFTRSLAKEMAPRGVTVNSIAPGFIATDMTDAIPEAQRDAILANVPARRLGKPEEIAATVVFLAGDAAAYITGETINVNGGLYTN
ncbi:MAG: 3-oxoacyl-ACP reductase FabG [Saccharospirillaceae bacterium]|nr:3-oxoacyl-ACP reductase FabG [Pseudomonadales bacterium]NRB78659.1 3-oxoacyl-ACP reductase FabG [Saccharospirillaceae bacterium]